jgi:hypothetical protein
MPRPAEPVAVDDPTADLSLSAGCAGLRDAAVTLGLGNAPAPRCYETVGPDPQVDHVPHSVVVSCGHELVPDKEHPMGFFDKVKGQAKEFKEKVGDKVEDVQGKRKATDLLDDLGRFLYAERTGRTISGADTEIDRIVGELKKLEEDGIKILPEH